MKLVVIETDARLNTVQDRTIVESRTEWTIPTPESFSQEDLFHLSWLLSVSATNASNNNGQAYDPSRGFEAWLQSDYYPDKFAGAFVAPLLQSLYVDFETGASAGSADADGVKKWMRDLPPAANPKEAKPRQAVRFELPLLPKDAL